MIEPLESYRGTVHPQEIDYMGHMNLRYYDAEKFDRATWNILIAYACLMRTFKKQGKDVQFSKHSQGISTNRLLKSNLY